MLRLRAFLSYASEDREAAAELAAVLDSMGLSVQWDHDLRPGARFSDDIRAMIRRSHLFFALLSKTSAGRPWIHQETGFAAGVGLPIVPIALDDTIPDALTKELQAVRLPRSAIGSLPQQLSRDFLEQQVYTRSDALPEGFVLFETPDERAERLAEFAREAMRLGGGRIRQRAALTAFCLPRSRPIPDDPEDVWKRRDGRQQRGPFIHQKLYEERRTLDELARASGCSLIIRPTIRLEPHGDDALIARLQELADFLRDTGFRDVDVATVQHSTAKERSVLIVGDWFYAESRSGQEGTGYEFTFCTWHAPFVLRKIREFDDEFAALVRRTNTERAPRRELAAEVIDHCLAAAQKRIDGATRTAG